MQSSFSVFFRLISKQIKLTISILLLICPQFVFGAVYYSRVGTGNFSTVGSWSINTNGSPTNTTALAATDDFIIQSGHNITLSAAQTVRNITINSGGTLTASTFVFTVNGTWTDNGTFNDGASSTVNFGGTFNISGSSTPLNFQNLTIGATSVRTMTASVAVAGNLVFTVPTGVSSLTLGANTLDVAGTVTMSNPASGTRSSTLAVGAGTLNVGGLFTMGATTNTSRINVLSISTGTANLAGITTAGVASRLTFTGAGTLNISGAVTATGTPTIASSTGTVNYSRSGTNQTVFNGTYYNLTLSGSNTKTNTTTTVNNIFSLEGTAVPSAAPTYGSNATLRYNTASSRTVGAEWLATFAATGGVVIDNTGAIITNGNKVFNLNVPLTINSGATLSPAAGNTFSFGGDLINNGSWTSSTGAVTIDLARTSQSIGRFVTSGLVTMQKPSGTATFTGNVNGGAFTLNGAGILDLGSGLTHAFSGVWTNTQGSLLGNSSTLRIGGTTSGAGITFTPANSTVDFNGTVAQIIPAFNYNNLTVSGNKGGATITLAAGTIGIADTFLPSATSAVYSVTGNTVAFNGAVQTIPAFTFNNVIFSGGNKTIQSNVTVKNLEIQTGPTMNINPPGVLTIN